MDESQLGATSLAAVGDQMAALLTRIYPPAGWFGRAVENRDILSFGLFVGASLGLYLVFAAVLSLFYQKIQNGLTAHGARQNYRVCHMTERSALMALYHKEWKGFLSSSVYVLNMGIGVLMAVAASAVVCFMGTDTLLGAMNVPGMEGYFSRILLFLPAVILPMSNTACVSLSLEGQQLWILKSSPVSLRQIFNAKIMVNLTIGVPGAVLSCLLLYFRVRPAFADGAAMLLLALVMVCFTAVIGIWINLKFPVYQWESQMRVVKQSTASFCGLFVGVIVSIGLAFIAVKLQTFPLWMVGGAEALVMGGLTFGLWRLLGRVKAI